MIIDLRLTGKRVVDFLLVLIEIFSVGVTARIEASKAPRTETPKASKDEWEGDTFSSRLGDLGERRHELPQSPSGSEAEPRPKTILELSKHVWNLEFGVGKPLVAAEFFLLCPSTFLQCFPTVQMPTMGGHKDAQS